MTKEPAKETANSLKVASGLASERLVTMLRAAATVRGCGFCRYCVEAELTVSELIAIIGQSQPRVSRHLKLLGEAGLLERFKEGSWVFYRAADLGEGAALGAAICGRSIPPSVKMISVGLTQIRKSRAAEASAFFKANAGQ